jgi:hypothetical protein
VGGGPGCDGQGVGVDVIMMRHADGFGTVSGGGDCLVDQIAYPLVYVVVWIDHLVKPEVEVLDLGKRCRRDGRRETRKKSRKMEAPQATSQ